MSGAHYVDAINLEQLQSPNRIAQMPNRRRPGAFLAAAYQSASIKADIAIALAFLQIARIDGKGRDSAKEKAERTVEAVHRRLPLIEDLLETADREWIRTSLVELQSALTTFDFPQEV